MTLRLTFGIDPGLSGALAALADGVPVGVLDMPSMDVGKDREVDARAIATWMRELRAAHAGAYISASLENVGAVPVEGRKQGGKSMFNFGDSTGQVKATLKVLGIPYVEVYPQTWKRYFGLTGTEKDAARLLAISRFPAIEHELRRKKDVGRADAALMALWHDTHQLMGAKAA
jgi:hypothetical protein